ncbi:hypothetical protein [Streptomyces sp. NPDC001985]|uniref:hypothetical protein n=1 Tax=Streptomyces sp. NPDC001985 TaxID=3154406 RepID=UPI0033225437
MAGSGWVDFSYRLTNRSERTKSGVSAYAEVYTPDEDGEHTARHVTLQWQVDGRWERIDFEKGYFGTAGSLKPWEYAEVRMRLSIDVKAEPGTAPAFSGGTYIERTEGGVHCEFGEGAVHRFEVLAPGGRPGEVDESTGERGGEETGGPGGGRTEGPAGRPANRPAPQGGLQELPVTGSLARTGAGSALPVIGAIGGVAVAAGAGVVLALRRRSHG